MVDLAVDMTDMNDVLWALMTRSDPQRDIQIIERAWKARSTRLWTSANVLYSTRDRRHTAHRVARQLLETGFGRHSSGHAAHEVGWILEGEKHNG